jgi:uncharacterized protein YjbI with pentapeptide repeats
VLASDETPEAVDGDADVSQDTHVPGYGSQRSDHKQRQHLQPQKDKSFDFNNPHAIADLQSISIRARVALACCSGVAFEMESLGGVLMQVLHSSHPLYALVSMLPSGDPPQLSIAFMIMNTKSVPLMQAAYLSAASHFNSVFSASKLAASMCKCSCNIFAAITIMLDDSFISISTKTIYAGMLAPNPQNITTLSPGTPLQLKSSGHSLGAMVAARLSTSELLAAPFTISQLKAAGCTAAQLKSASCSAADLKAAAFSCSELRAAKFDAFFLVQAGFSKADLKAAGFDAVALRAAGCSAGALKQAGFSLADLLAARFDAPTFLAAGFTIAQLKAARFDALSLKIAGCSATDLKKAGFSAAELRAANYDAPTLVAAGITRLELKSAGCETVRR